MTPPLPRFRFRSKHSGLTLEGPGWRAQFEGGRFATDDERVASGVVKRAAAHPEYGIELVRGAEKPPEPATAPAPTKGEGG